ncbi:hypothetical protein VOLCADRAFT_94035 [Volvox carteri f. nagariensis]|uniref:Uncharacterized protein n=1 Tax=Volvox carteri f. nagariensis TaxID=3068 RepID=D8U3R4_VOLCA|nr:uncharacterized protein VOLCADRAFT_94035 [Volvox carteri f. nagariensis]EFJ45656.1 hypothetical protein VOLCADRAFT_94035 [Volvox carteri f. nagariensis]|eukprot:XP_002953346.1 hypothetical protein VOLCADRAFT_94035 [Volvox carteri f. nagariensis]
MLIMHWFLAFSLPNHHARYMAAWPRTRDVDGVSRDDGNNDRGGSDYDRPRNDDRARDRRVWRRQQQPLPQDSWGEQIAGGGSGSRSSRHDTADLPPNSPQPLPLRPPRPWRTPQGGRNNPWEAVASEGFRRPTGHYEYDRGGGDGGGGGGDLQKPRQDAQAYVAAHVLGPSQVATAVVAYSRLVNGEATATSPLPPNDAATAAADLDAADHRPDDDDDGSGRGSGRGAAAPGRGVVPGRLREHLQAKLLEAAPALGLKELSYCMYGLAALPRGYRLLTVTEDAGRRLSNALLSRLEANLYELADKLRSTTNATEARRSRRDDDDDVDHDGSGEREHRLEAYCLTYVCTALRKLNVVRPSVHRALAAAAAPLLGNALAGEALPPLVLGFLEAGNPEPLFMEQLVHQSSLPYSLARTNSIFACTVLLRAAGQIGAEPALGSLGRVVLYPPLLKVACEAAGLGPGSELVQLLLQEVMTLSHRTCDDENENADEKKWRYFSGDIFFVLKHRHWTLPPPQVKRLQSGWDMLHRLMSPNITIPSLLAVLYGLSHLRVRPERHAGGGVTAAAPAATAAAGGEYGMESAAAGVTVPVAVGHVNRMPTALKVAVQLVDAAAPVMTPRQVIQALVSLAAAGVTVSPPLLQRAEHLYGTHVKGAVGAADSGSTCTAGAAGIAHGKDNVGGDAGSGGGTGDGGVGGHEADPATTSTAGSEVSLDQQKPVIGGGGGGGANGGRVPRDLAPMCAMVGRVLAWQPTAAAAAMLSDDFVRHCRTSALGASRSGM